MKYPTLIDKAFLLKRTPPFSSLDLDLLLAVADKLGLIQFEAGHEIFVAGEEANRMYFVLKGQVSLFTKKDEKTLMIESGFFFGEEALLNNKPRAYCAITTMVTSVLTLSRTNLFATLSECPSVAIGFLQQYATILPFRFSPSPEREL